MVAFALRADGWYLRPEIIWHKLNPMPESVTDRPTKAHEQVFLLSKSGTAQFWTHRDHSGTTRQPEPDYRWRNNKTGEEVSAEPADWHTAVYIDEDCEGEDAKLWTRINLWTGHDYFYDADAIREPHLYDHDRRNDGKRHTYSDAAKHNQADPDR